MCSTTLLCNPNAKETEKQRRTKCWKISTSHFPNKAKHKEVFERWRNAVRPTNWFPTENSVLCENHFLADDFKEERSDKNNSRRTGKGTNLQRKELKPNAVPSLWPDCPKLLSKVPPQERPTCISTSTAWYERQHELKQFKDLLLSTIWR